jgi:hypothetical protein
LKNEISARKQNILPGSPILLSKVEACYNPRLGLSKGAEPGGNKHAKEVAQGDQTPRGADPQKPYASDGSEGSES